MKQLLFFLSTVFILSACSHDGFVTLADKTEGAVNILFLHHSTGKLIYQGAATDGTPDVQKWFADYNKKNDTKYNFAEHYFPSAKKNRFVGYGWNNYPYDYYNIWVKNQNKSTYKGEPSLDLLTQHWNVIIFKHCFPVSEVVCTGEGNIDSPEKTLANYKLQYQALAQKLKSYPNTKFIVWTGAALTRDASNEESAQCARTFAEWVKNEWDQPNDNIFVWDFFDLETEGGIYLKDEYAYSPKDSHPNENFAYMAAPLLCQRVVDVISNNGEKTDLCGNIFPEESEDITNADKID